MWGSIATTNTLSLLTLLALLVNAGLVYWYVRITAQIRDQAISQTEGLARPALVFFAPNSQDLLRFGREVEFAASQFSEGYLRNIGSGPALDIKITVTNQGKVYTQEVSHLCGGGLTELSNVLMSTVAAPGADVIAEYHSLGGVQYRSQSWLKTAVNASTTIKRVSG